MCRSKGTIEELLRHCEASKGTAKGYVSEVMHVLAKVNSACIHEVLAKLEVYETELRLKCETPMTETNHIEKVHLQRAH